MAERTRAEDQGSRVGLVCATCGCSGPSAHADGHERTVREIGRELAIGVIEGDQETDRDAARLRSAGCPVVQLNTRTGCHLDAPMVKRGLQQLSPSPGCVLLIENVKYPHMFRAATVVLLNKIDLLPYVAFDPARFLAHEQQVNGRLRVFPLSAAGGDGLEDGYGWLREKARHGAA